MAQRQSQASVSTLAGLTALVAILLTVTLHIVALRLSGQDALATPINDLSRGGYGILHTLALVLFGFAHMSLFVALKGFAAGALWRVGRVLLVGAALALLYVALFFANAPESMLAGSRGSVPLWTLSSLAGVAMAAALPGLWRVSRGLGLFNAICLALWLLSVPLFFVVDAAWLGGLQRGVGVTYAAWLGGLALGVLAYGR